MYWYCIALKKLVLFILGSLKRMCLINNLYFQMFYIFFYSLQSWVNHLHQVVVLGYGHLVQHLRDRLAGGSDNLANKWAERGREEEKKRKNRRRSRACNMEIRRRVIVNILPFK